MAQWWDRALASLQCGLGSIPGPGVICGLNLLLDLYSAPRSLSFPLSSKTNISKFQFDPGMHGHFKRVLVNSWCSVGKLITFSLYFTSSTGKTTYWERERKLALLSILTKFGQWNDLIISQSRAIFQLFSLYPHIQQGTAARFLTLHVA